MASMIRVSSMGQHFDGSQLSITRLTFNKHDTDRSETLDKEEFKAMIFHLGHYMDEIELEAAFTFVELNGDGQITYDEFNLWWMAEDRWGLLALTEAQKAALYQFAEVFQYYDEDFSGELDTKEFSGIYKYMKEAGYNLGSLTETGVLKEVDTTGDGEINYNEFITWMVTLGHLQGNCFVACCMLLVACCCRCVVCLPNEENFNISNAWKRANADITETLQSFRG